MSKEKLEKDYYADRPTEPYSDDDSPNDWANIAHYAEENLEKAFKKIAELEQQIEGKENEFKYFSRSFKMKIAKQKAQIEKMKSALIDIKSNTDDVDIEWQIKYLLDELEIKL